MNAHLLMLLLSSAPSATVLVAETGTDAPGEVAYSSVAAVVAAHLASQKPLSVRTQEAEMRRLANGVDVDGQFPVPLEPDWVVGVALLERHGGARVLLDSYSMPEATHHDHAEADVATGDAWEALKPKLKAAVDVLLAGMKRAPPPRPALTPQDAESTWKGMPLSSSLSPAAAEAPYPGTLKAWLARGSNGRGLVVALGLDANRAPILFSGTESVLYAQPLKALGWERGGTLTTSWPESPLVGPAGVLALHARDLTLECASVQTSLLPVNVAPHLAALRTVTFQRTPLFATADAAGNLFLVDFPNAGAGQGYRVWIGRAGVFHAVEAGYATLGDVYNAFFTPFGTLVVQQTHDHAARWITSQGTLPLTAMDRDRALHALYLKQGPYAQWLPATPCLQNIVLSP